MGWLAREVAAASRLGHKVVLHVHDMVGTATSSKFKDILTTGNVRGQCAAAHAELAGATLVVRTLRRWVLRARKRLFGVA